MRIRICLFLMIACLLAGCTQTNNREQNAQSSDNADVGTELEVQEEPTEVESAYFASEHDFELVQLNLVGAGWIGLHIQWLSDTKLLAVMSDEASTCKLILLDLETSSEITLLELEDEYIGSIYANDAEIVVTTVAATIVISRADYSVDRQDRIGNDWGSDAIGGLAAVRDDLGLAIRSRDGAGEDVRIATAVDGEYLYDNPVWSPDGELVMYYRYIQGQMYPVHLNISRRDGTFLYEIDSPEYYTPMWSNDSNTIVIAVRDESGGFEEFRVYDAYSGEMIAASAYPYPGVFSNVCNAYQALAACWREQEPGGDLIVFGFDVENGEHKDYMSVRKQDRVPDFCLSPDGTMLAISYYDGQIALVSM